MSPASGHTGGQDQACRLCAVDLPQATWRKSSRSTYSGACVEVARIRDGLVGVRDSKAGETRPVVTFGAGEWGHFLRRVKNGEFDPGT